MGKRKRREREKGGREDVVYRESSHRQKDDSLFLSFFRHLFQCMSDQQQQQQQQQRQLQQQPTDACLTDVGCLCELQRFCEASLLPTTSLTLSSHLSFHYNCHMVPSNLIFYAQNAALCRLLCPYIRFDSTSSKLKYSLNTGC